MSGTGEGKLRAGPIADFGVDHHVGQIVVETRRTGFQGVRRLKQHRQRLVVDDDTFGRLLRQR